MNREEAQALLPIITAFAEGKEIQINYGSSQNPNWSTNHNLVFDGNVEDYRVKPEPRTLWVISNRFNERIYSDNSEDRVKKELDRLNRGGTNSPYTLAKFVEQL